MLGWCLCSWVRWDVSIYVVICSVVWRVVMHCLVGSMVLVVVVSVVLTLLLVLIFYIRVGSVLVDTNLLLCVVFSGCWLLGGLICIFLFGLRVWMML